MPAGIKREVGGKDEKGYVDGGFTGIVFRGGCSPSGLLPTTVNHRRRET
jgi:hypothetical protein